MEDRLVQEDPLDDVDENDCEELPDVEREDVDAKDGVEGNRDEGYRDLLDKDRLGPRRGEEGAVGGGVRT